MVEFLRMWAAGKPHADKLWPGRWAANRGGGKMIQHDLKAAGIPYEVDSRKADFHALRYTFITNLIKAGEHPAAVQRMARHSDINLTFRVYADLGLEDLYHGALRGPAVTSSTVGQGAPRKRSKRATNGAKKNLDGNGDESPTGAESVALNVALPGVPEQRELTSNVTDKTISKEPTRSPGLRKLRSKTQRATGVDATCRPLSQNDPAEREGNDPTALATSVIAECCVRYRNGSRTCDFTLVHSRSLDFPLGHLVLATSFHKCFTRGRDRRSFEIPDTTELQVSYFAPKGQSYVSPGQRPGKQPPYLDRAPSGRRGQRHIVWRSRINNRR